MDDQISRRRLLAGTTAMGAFAVAGCLGGGDGDGGGPTRTATGTATDDAPATATETEPATATATRTATATEAGGDETTDDGETAAPTATATATRTRTRTATATPTATETAASGRLTVVIEGISFSPIRARVAPGTTVEWINRHRAPHTVTSARFHDAAQRWSFDERLPGGRDATTEFTFEDPGVYEYLCTIHGSQVMCGAVLVGDVSLDAELPCE